MVEVTVPIRAVISRKFVEPVITLPPAVTVTPLNPDGVGYMATQVQPNPELSQPAPIPTSSPTETQQASVTPPTIPGADHALIDEATKTPDTSPAPTTATSNIPNPTPNRSYGGVGVLPVGTQAAGYPAYAYGQPFYMRGSNGEYINPRTKLSGSNIPLSFFQQKQMRPFDLDYWHQHPYYPGNNGIPGGLTGPRQENQPTFIGLVSHPALAQQKPPEQQAAAEPAQA